MKNVRLGQPVPYEGRVMLPGETHELPDNVADSLVTQNMATPAPVPAKSSEPRPRNERGTYARSDMKAKE
jgi:hypothetical protein